MRKMPRAKKMLLDNLGAENETARIEAIKRKRMIEAQKARERRANQTPEEVAARRMRDAQRARERRARLTAEQMAQQRQRDAILKRQRRAKETEAEKAIRRSLEAQKARERRARLLGKKQGIEGFCEVARMGLSHFEGEILFRQNYYTEDDSLTNDRLLAGCLVSSLQKTGSLNART